MDVGAKNVVGALGGKLAYGLSYVGNQPDDVSYSQATPNDQYSIRNHVFLAFLLMDQARMPKSKGVLDCMVSKVRHWWTGMEVQHVETFFVGKNDKARYNVSVDSERMRVFWTKNKKYRRGNWVVVAIPCSDEMVTSMRRFAIAQTKKPYDEDVYCNFLYLTPEEDEKRSYTCAHLALSILQAGGLWTRYDGRRMTDARLLDLVSFHSAVKWNPIIQWDVDRVVEAQKDVDAMSQYREPVV